MKCSFTGGGQCITEGQGKKWNPTLSIMLDTVLSGVVAFQTCSLIGEIAGYCNSGRGGETNLS